LNSMQPVLFGPPEIEERQIPVLPAGVVFVNFNSYPIGTLRVSAYVRGMNTPAGRLIANAWAIGGVVGADLSSTVQMLARPMTGHQGISIISPGKSLAPGIYWLENGFEKDFEFAVGEPIEAARSRCFDLLGGPPAPCGEASAAPQPDPGTAVPPASDSPSTPPSAPTPPPQPDCGTYSACLAHGDAALKSFDWLRAVADLKAASAMNTAEPDAWAKLGLADLASGLGAELPSAWDNALARGATIAFGVWRAAGMHWEKGLFQVSQGAISFIGLNGETVFSVPPSQVSDLEAHLHHLGLPSSNFGMKAGGRRYWFAFQPLGVDCKTPSNCNNPAGYSQEEVVANYVVQAIRNHQ
jgi:hypothetical protein